MGGGAIRLMANVSVTANNCKFIDNKTNR